MHIAIFGCGQLAQMTAQAGKMLDLEFSFIADPGEDTRCVDGLGAIVTCAPTMSAKDLFSALGEPNVITVEKEMVDATLLAELEKLTQVSPGSNAIHIAQNRIREKNYLRDCGIPTADFEILTSVEQLETLPDHLSLPIYIKAAESGYDGYNQWQIKKVEDLEQPELIAAIESGVEIIAEKHVAYSREFSIIAARNLDGDIVCYPVMENKHEEGVLIATVAPAPDAQYQQQAESLMKDLMNKLEYVGVLTMECFETADGIVANELAPRVHNSGHWTIEGSATSQFENHCRAIANMTLGETAVDGYAGLVNMLGHHGDEAQLTLTNQFYHAYGKTERPRRKLGHVTVCSQNLEELKAQLNTVMTALYAEKYPAI